MGFGPQCLLGDSARDTTKPQKGGKKPLRAARTFPRECTRADFHPAQGGSWELPRGGHSTDPSWPPGPAQPHPGP